INTGRQSSLSSLPLAVCNNFLQRNPVARTAPGGDQDIRIHAGHFFGGNLPSGRAQKLTPSGFYQFRNPGLRRNQRLAPFFAEDSWASRSRGLSTNPFDVPLHVSDNFFAA